MIGNMKTMIDVNDEDLALAAKELGTTTKKDTVNAAFKKASAEGPLSGFLRYSDEELVSCDFIGDPASCILDSKTNPWGITVHSVEIRDVHIPQALEETDLALMGATLHP